jgi:hypothetical protein
MKGRGTRPIDQLARVVTLVAYLLGSIPRVLSEDPNEQRNLGEGSGVQDVLRQLRTALERLTLGPLLLGRFQP